MQRARITQWTLFPNVTWYDPTAGRSQSSVIRKTIQLQRSSLVSEVSMLKTATLLCLLILLASFPAFSQKASARFDPDGSFWVLGQLPNEFPELSAINLNAKKLRRLPSPGLQLTNDTTYPFK